MKIRTRFAVAALTGTLASSVALADSVTIAPSKDNTLIEPGGNSNGMGDGIYSGRTSIFGGETLRRAVIAFDLEGSVPSGAVITAVTLTLDVTNSNTGVQTHSIHGLLADWGEGTSSSFGGQGAAATPGDATWIHTFFDTDDWTTPGGDYVAGADASASVGMSGSEVVFGTTAAMVDRVQGWVDVPASNFGWIIIGNESTGGTAKKFGSAQAPLPEWIPQLMVEFDPPYSCDGDINDSGDVGFEDLLEVLSNWGPYGPCPPYIASDLDEDCQVGFTDLLVVLSNWGPCV